MALTLPKDATKKKTTWNTEDGLYKVLLAGQEDKKDEKEDSKRKGYSFHNLKFQFENKKTLYARVYYLNNEGDIDPVGYNFILSLREILNTHYADDPKMLAKIEDADSNKILNALIKNKIPFYIATKKSIYQGDDITNINTFVDAIATLSEAEEVSKKRELPITSLLPAEDEKSSKADVEEDEEDDL